MAKPDVTRNNSAEVEALRNRKPKGSPVGGIVLLLVIAFVAFLFLRSSDDSDAPVDPAFADAASSILERNDRAVAAVTDKLDEAAATGADAATTYSSLEKAKGRIDALRTEWRAVDRPDNADAQKAYDAIQTAFYKEAKAMDHVLAAIDEDSVAEKAKARDDFGSAQGWADDARSALDALPTDS